MKTQDFLYQSPQYQYAVIITNLRATSFESVAIFMILHLSTIVEVIAPFFDVKFKA